MSVWATCGCRGDCKSEVLIKQLTSVLAQQVHATAMPSDLLKDLDGLRTQAGSTYPELQHLELDGSNDVYPQDVEAEANEWFQKVYHEKLNIEDFVSMLKGWQV